MSDRTPEPRQRGAIAWMVGNRVTPNLLMLFLILGGLFMSTRIKQEVFPAFDLDVVSVRVAYPGASPEEVEQGIVLAIEEAVSDIDGLKEMTATASEGVATIYAELLKDADQQKAYQDIKQEVDRITTFPEDSEEPVVSLATSRRRVLSLELFGDVPERELREVVEQTRDRLLQNPQITQADLIGGRDHEVLVDVPLENLRAHGLTLAEVARIVQSASVELPGGKLETSGGELLLRMSDRRDWADEFARIPVITTAAGAVLYLEDIAEVREGFEDSDRVGSYNGKRSMGLSIYRVGDQTPIGVSEAVSAAMAEIEPDLPAGIDWSINNDRSKVFQQRLEMLLKNAALGLLLVLVVLGLFLEFKLAFWVTMGIPISFLGGLLFLPGADVSINMISMFAFIIALGIVVDDAVIAGENIYEYRQRGMNFSKAAILGARDVAVPITFSILTNIAAFLPLAFVPGTMGKIFRVVPMVVVTVFLISWLESLLILPSHLAHTRSQPLSGLTATLHGWQQAFSRQVVRFIDRVYGPFLDRCLRWRGLTVAIGVTILCLIGGYVLSGRISMILMPRVESDLAVVTAVLPYGSPSSRVAEVQDRLVTSIKQVGKEHDGEALLKGVFSLIDENKVEVTAYLEAPDIRPLSTRDVTLLWREQVGQIPGLQSLRFESDRGGPGRGAALSVELSHRDIEVLDRASAALGEQLAQFPKVTDVDDGYTPGKQQLDFRMTPEGESLGLTASEVARQVRNAFQGVIALRQQRGSNELTVRVRLPERQRLSEHDVETLLISTPAGRFVPLLQVAEIKRGRAYTSISRREGRRTVTVTGNVDPIGETGKVMTALNKNVLPKLAADYPGLSVGYQGRQADQKESLQGLFGGFVMALLLIYFLLAIPFRSYVQPLIVLVAIPFGIVGAVIGHIIMGYNLSLVSMLGLVALSGVVANDSLILIDFANRRIRDGDSPLEAIRAAGLRRFRPILLTTLTTFGGLMPMILETSRQARFLIPMAISLGYGILFATLITLVLVPSLYLLIEDFLGMFKRSCAPPSHIE